MHDKERSDGILFFFKKQPFPASTNIQLWCLIAWSKKTHLVIAYIQRLFVRGTGTLFKANKHLIALECFVKKAAKHGLIETQFTLICFWMKEEFWCESFWYARWFKMGQWGQSVKALLCSMFMTSAILRCEERHSLLFYITSKCVTAVFPLDLPPLGGWGGIVLMHPGSA